MIQMTDKAMSYDQGHNGMHLAQRQGRTRNVYIWQMSASKVKCGLFIELTGYCMVPYSLQVVDGMGKLRPAVWLTFNVIPRPSNPRLGGNLRERFTLKSAQNLKVCGRGTLPFNRGCGEQ